MLHIISFVLLVAVTNAEHFCEPSKDPWELCNDHSRGHFLVADPTNCQIFYSCEASANNSHIPHTLKCMEGHGFNDNLFNENFWRCDYKSNVPRCSCTQPCKKEDNYDYLGNDIESRRTNGQEDCANWCGAHKECNVWTLRKSDNWCWIKTSDAGRSKDNLFISGTKGCATEVVFPDPEKYYVIENAVYPGSRIQGNAAKERGECTTQSHGSTRQNWRFEPVGQAYYIFNQEARYHRLCSAKWAFKWNNDFCLYAEKLSDNQKWRLTPVGGNKFRITNVDNNFKLGQWAPGKCGTGDWAQNDDQIWELKEVE